MDCKLKLQTLPLVVLMLATAACSSSAPGTGGGAAAPGATGGGGGGAPAISVNDKPLDVMLKAMRGQFDAKSYRANVTTWAGDDSTQMVLEYVAPDRYRMVSEPKAGGGAQGFGREFIIIGNATYLKGPNGQWVKSPVDMGALVKTFRDPKVLEELAKTSDAKFVGTDTLDGVPTLIYQYTQNNVMGMNVKAVSKTWLAVSDGLPRKSESEGEFNGMKTRTLMTISDYNSDIRIEAPTK